MIDNFKLLKLLAFFATPHLCVWILSPVIGSLVTIVLYVVIASIQFALIAFIGWMVNVLGGPMNVATMSKDDMEKG